jgi:hypothetical protein
MRCRHILTGESLSVGRVHIRARSGAHPMTKDRTPTVIVLFLFLVAISVAECVVCLLGGDL